MVVPAIEKPMVAPTNTIKRINGTIWPFVFILIIKLPQDHLLVN